MLKNTAKQTFAMFTVGVYNSLLKLLQGDRARMQRSDWILLVLDAAGDDALSPVQLQKTIFLIRKNFPKTTGRRFYAFSAYNYGPFCASIYSDAVLLADNGLIEISQSDGNGYALYSITEDGRAKANKLKGELSSKPKDYITRVVHWAQSLTFTQLVKAIYDKYPEYRANSVFKY